MNTQIKHCALLVIFCAFPFFSHAEEKEALNIQIDQIIAEHYPSVKAYAVIKDTEGELVSGLSPTLFSFRIDSAEVKLSAQITPFSMTDEGVDYAIMISNNGIMEGEPLDFQKSAILQFVEQMNDTDTVSVYTIGEEAGTICEGVTRKTFDSAVINSIELSTAQPRLYDSLINLIRKMEQKPGERKVVIVLSDGRDQNSRFTKEQLEDTLQNAGIPIYTVGMRILSNETLSTLDEISQLTGGAYYYASRISNIADTMTKIIACCKQCYILDLKVKGLKADNEAHILEVLVDELDRQGKGAKTFIAVKHPIPQWLKLVWIAAGCAAAAGISICTIMRKIQKRKRMGITKRRCPDCRNIMKDNWEFCPFCKYLPQVKQKRNRKGKRTD